VNKQKTTNKTAVLEGKLAALEAKVQKLTEGKKNNFLLKT
jgi:BMFP domain-containing protein YqiC